MSLTTLLFLPVVVNTAKDAARSVKKKFGSVIEKLNEMTVSQLLNLPQLIVEGMTIEKRNKEEILHLYCEHRHEIAVFPLLYPLLVELTIYSL